MQIQVVFFDIGDILEINAPTGAQERWGSELKLGPGALNERMADVWERAEVGAITEPEMNVTFRERLGMNDEQIERFWADMWEQYLGTPNVELIEYFDNLRARVRTGIISNSGVGAREKEQERYGFEDLCDVIVYSHEEGVAKPDHRIYEIACERMNVRPEHALLLDDLEENIVAAEEFGFHGVLFANNAQAIEEIEGLLRLP